MKKKTAIKRTSTVVAPLAHVIRLTKKEIASISAFADERVMSFLSYNKNPDIYAKKLKPKLSADQLEHLRAVFFNAIVAAYAGGLQTKSRGYKLSFSSGSEFTIAIIQKRR